MLSLLTLDAAQCPVQGQKPGRRRALSSFPPHDRHRVGRPKTAAPPPLAAAIVGDHQFASVAGAALPPPPPPDVSQLVAADLKQAQQYFTEVLRYAPNNGPFLSADAAAGVRCPVPAFCDAGADASAPEHTACKILSGCRLHAREGAAYEPQLVQGRKRLAASPCSLYRPAHFVRASSPSFYPQQDAVFHLFVAVNRFAQTLRPARQPLHLPCLAEVPELQQLHRLHDAALHHHVSLQPERRPWRHCCTGVLAAPSFFD